MVVSAGLGCELLKFQPWCLIFSTHFLCSEKDVEDQWRTRLDEVIKELLYCPKISNLLRKPRYGLFTGVHYSSSDHYGTHHINDSDTERDIRGCYDNFSWSELCTKSYYGWKPLELLQN